MTMFLFRHPARVLLAISTAVGCASADTVTEIFPYVAHITTFPDSDNADVSGVVVVAATADVDAPLFYGGFVSNLQSNLDGTSTDCSDNENGCGVHIHSGYSCNTTDLQEGHYYEDLDDDPWQTARYSSNDEGYAVFGDLMEIGSSDVEGRAFVVHAQDGSRVGCGLLEPIDDDNDEDMRIFQALTSPISPDDSSASAQVMVIANLPAPEGESDDINDRLCYYGFALDLEVDIVSNAIDGDSTYCTETNGCGTHIHSGTACTDTDTQGGHWYDEEEASDGTVMEDPWLLLGYTETTSTGSAWFGSCVHVGVDALEAEDLPFVVHNNAGGRVSCGILTTDDIATATDDDDDAVGDDDDDDDTADDDDDADDTADDDDDETSSASPDLLWTTVVGLAFLPVLALW